MQRSFGSVFGLGLCLLSWALPAISATPNSSANSAPTLSETNKPILVWAKNYAPPFYINEGPDKDHGFADEVQSRIEAMLPQYQHQTVYMPLPRLNEFWRKKENYCFASMIFTSLPPSPDYLLSRPNVYYLPHGIISRQDFVASQTNSELSLQTLLTNPNWVMGIINNRSFDATIDELILQNQDITRTFVRNDHHGLEGLLNMLLLGRIDYLIDYPFVYHYYAKQDAFVEKIRFSTIRETQGTSKENQGTGVIGAVGCTNNDWGETRGKRY